MSRSYHHHLTHMPCCYDKSWKKLYNRRLRRAFKNDLDFPNGNHYRKLNESWNIVDFRCDVSWEDFRKWNWVRERYFDSEEEAYAHWKRCYGSK